MMKWFKLNRIFKTYSKLSKTLKNWFKETICYKRIQMKHKIKQNVIRLKQKDMIKW